MLKHKIVYFLLTTLWAFLVPAVVIHALPCLFIILIAMGGGGNDVIERGFWALISLAFIGSASAFCIWYGMRLIDVYAEYNDEPDMGTFFLWILPYWMPLFWGLFAIAFVTYNAAYISHQYYVNHILWAFPQYFAAYVFTLIMGDIDFFILGSLSVTLVLALIPTIWIAPVTQPGAKWKSFLLCFGITLLLGIIAGYTHNHFRNAYLPPASDETIVRDEPNGQQDTNLSEYIPFAENNKLVKIESPTLTIDSEHPKIDGATALFPVYAAAVQAIYQKLDKKLDDYGKFIYAKASTSPETFESLLDQRSDLIIMAMPSEKQLQAAKDRNIELVITPLGYEAFVFFASTVNPVEELTLEQIRRIYSKRITNWNEVGGNDERILPFQRPEGSGSQTAMLRLMDDVPLAPPLQEEFRRGMGAIVTDVADYRNYGNALGFSFRYYVEGLFKHEGVKLLKVEGIAPTIENIQKGTYPLTGEFVFITRQDNANPNVAKLRDWFLSPQGQELIEKVGYVPLVVRKNQ